MRLSARRLKISIIFALIQVIPGTSHLHGESELPKVGLVLSGGGARGGAHIGVLKVLEREKIPIDYIAGTSFGALVGAFYALGHSPEEIEEIFLKQDWGTYFSDTPERRLASLSDRRGAGYQVQLSFHDWVPELPKGLWEGQQLREVLNRYTTVPMLEYGYDFDKLPIPFRAVATDLVKFEPYEFSEGSMTEALRASVAIPVFFTPVEKGDMLLVDGGLTNNLPADVVKRMGADIVIAVDVSSPLLKENELRNLLNTSDQISSGAIKKNMEENEHLVDLKIKPDLDGFTTYSFSDMPEIIQRGEEEAERLFKELNALVVGLPPRNHHTVHDIPDRVRVVDHIKFNGLENVPERQAKREVRTRTGKPLDLPVLIGDMKRLYGTQLFDRVDYFLRHVAEDRYELIFDVRETSMLTLDAGIRYDNDYKFVALGQLTYRQLFDSPTRLIVASRFGGYEDHSATLRYTPSYLPFLFVEAKGFASRRERQYILNKEWKDDYTVRRLGGQIMFGGTFFKQLEFAAGYRMEDVRVIGGSPYLPPVDSDRLGGFTLQINRDSLDDREFPSRGMVLGLQADAVERRFGGDFDYFKFRLEGENYFSISEKSTIGIRLMAGFAEYDAPFYDGFYVGGYSFSRKGSYPFLGFERDEILSEEAAVLGIQYRRRIYSPSLGFVKSAYLTTFFNSGVDGFPGGKGLHGAGIGLALQTVLGPMHITGGFGSDGRANFYFTYGPEF